MQITIGTANFNNLFSRFDFRLEAEVGALPPGEVEYEKIRKIVTEDIPERAIEYRGRALKHKEPAARKALAERIARLNLDIVAVQEVEDLETLEYFARHEVGNGALYPYITLVEGNDPRLIDLAVLSRYPLGAVTTWKHAEHPDIPGERIFSRDMLQFEVLNTSRTKRLFTGFNNHLKSHFVPFTDDPIEGAKRANAKRRAQAEAAAQIIATQMRPDSPFVILGDMNDHFDSPQLAPLVGNAGLGLVNALQNAEESHPIPATSSPPATHLWTHRFKPANQPAEYHLFDQIWLSPTLAPHLVSAHIDRRSKLGGDGTDHDPAWVKLEL